MVEAVLSYRTVVSQCRTGSEMEKRMGLKEKLHEVLSTSESKGKRFSEVVG